MIKKISRPLIAVIIAAIVLLAAAFALKAIAASNKKAELQEMMETLLPGSYEFIPQSYDGDDEAILSVYKGETGFIIETSTHGYVDMIVLLTGVSNSGEVTGVVVREMKETHGLGKSALTDTEFLSQFLGTRGDASIGDNIDALSAATVTSKTIAKGVNSAAAYVTGADVSSEATEWGG